MPQPSGSGNGLPMPGATDRPHQLAVGSKVLARYQAKDVGVFLKHFYQADHTIATMVPMILPTWPATRKTMCH